MPADCLTLWIGPSLGDFERACLISALRHGHRVALYCYAPPAHVPQGVELRDAADILPESTVIRHRESGSPALFSNLFRYELQRRALGTWIDCDAYMLGPLDDSAPYLMGWQDGAVINSGVLRLPADSPILTPLINLFAQRDVPPWLPFKARAAARWRLLTRGRSGVEHMPWGTAGPHALTAAAKAHGLERHALPVDILYPVHWSRADWIYRPDLTLDSVVGPDAVSLHLWAKCLAPLRGRDPPLGSFAERLVAESRAVPDL